MYTIRSIRPLATAQRTQPWQELDTARRQFDQLLEGWLPPVTREALGRYAPAIELYVTDTTVVLKAELPGIPGSDLNIQVTRETVLIETERHTSVPENAQVHRSELRNGAIHRVVQLPVEVDQDAVKAEFELGILTLTLPRLKDDRTKAVQVSLAQTEKVQTETPDTVQLNDAQS